MTLIADIESLAKIERALPANPFFRRNFGGWVMRSMQRREMFLTAVLEIFEGNTMEFVDPMPSETVSQARERVGRFERRLLASFMNKWNTLYTQEPTRVFMYDGERLESGDDRLEVLQEEYRNSGVDDIMEQSDTLLRLTGNVALRPWYDADNKQLVIHLYSGNSIRVLENRNNPQVPRAVALVGSFRLEESDGGAINQHNAEFFTPDEMGTVVGGKIHLDKLETRAIPIAYGWDKRPTNKTGFFVPSPGLPLAGLDRLLASDFTSQLGFITLMQGFGIPVVWGLKAGTELRIGPDRTIEFDGDPDRKEDFEFKNPNAPLEEIRDIINQLVVWTQEDYDIPKSMLDISMAPSGVAQVEAMAPIGTLRLKRTKQMRPLESRTVKRIADVLIASNRLSQSLDPELFEVSVTYPEPEITKTTTDQIAQDRFDLEIGIITRAEIFMRDNPDRFDSEDEAEQFLRTRGAMLESPVTEGEPESISPVETGSPLSGEDLVETEIEVVTTGDGVSETDPAGEAMNGAQVTALQGLVEAVSAGAMAAKSAALVVRNAFPTIPEEDVEEMFRVAEEFDPKKDEPAPDFGGNTGHTEENNNTGHEDEDKNTGHTKEDDNTGHLKEEKKDD